MTTTLERAARAAYDGYGFKPRDDMGSDLKFDELAGFQKDNWRNTARAVLMAVREPDGPGENRIDNVGLDWMPGYDPRSGDSTDVFTAMIDAILNEEKTND